MRKVIKGVARDWFNRGTYYDPVSDYNFEGQWKQHEASTLEKVFLIIMNHMRDKLNKEKSENENRI